MAAPEPVRLVRVTEANALTYKQVRLAMLADSPGAFTTTYATAAAMTDDDWRARARSSTSFIAYAAGEPSGAATLYRHTDAPPGEALLVAMWVAPVARGRGVGQALVRRVADEARDRGLRRLRLDVVKGNDPARLLYQRCGFVLADRPDWAQSDGCADQDHMALDLALDSIHT